MIIDCHTHIFPDEVRKDRQAFCKREPGFAAIYREPKSRMAGAEELIASMDAAGVEKSVICGFSWDDPGLCVLHNQYLLKSAEKYSHRFIVFLSPPPDEPGPVCTRAGSGAQGRSQGGGGDWVLSSCNDRAGRRRDEARPGPLGGERGPSPPSHKRDPRAFLSRKREDASRTVLRNHSRLSSPSHPARSLGAAVSRSTS